VPQLVQGVGAVVVMVGVGLEQLGGAAVGQSAALSRWIDVTSPPTGGPCGQLFAPVLARRAERRQPDVESRSRPGTPHEGEPRSPDPAPVPAAPHSCPRRSRRPTGSARRRSTRRVFAAGIVQRNNATASASRTPDRRRKAPHRPHLPASRATPDYFRSRPTRKTHRAKSSPRAQIKGRYLRSLVSAGFGSIDRRSTAAFTRERLARRR
jgi:hypothetical protein